MPTYLANFIFFSAAFFYARFSEFLPPCPDKLSPEWKRSERNEALDKLKVYRRKKAAKKRKREEEEEKKKRTKLAWKTKMSEITAVLIAENITKQGKVGSVPQVRKFLIKKKKLNRKDQKTITESNVVEKWAELYWNSLGWDLSIWEFCTNNMAEFIFFSIPKNNLCQDVFFAVLP